jgi:ferredoxin-nitrite reductase
MLCTPCRSRETPDWKQVGFNVELGGYFSIKRNTTSINGNTFLKQDQVVAYCKALLEFFRYTTCPLN